MEYAKVRQGYLNLWAKVALQPSKAPAARAVAKRLLKDKKRYETIGVQLGGIPWFWIAAIHNLEASGNFTKYLGNGQALTMRTTIEPLNRGPFKSFEHGAVDALRLKGLHNIKVWDISRCLYEAERYNGFGYVGRINSPYVWSLTNLQQRGKYIRDHVWDPNYLSTQCGVAATFKALEEMGELKFEGDTTEDGMAELKASLLPFAGIAPLLVRTLAGGAANLAVKALIEALDDKDAAPPSRDAGGVQKKLEEVPLKEMPDLLAVAEDLLKTVIGTGPDVDDDPARDPLPGTIGGAVPQTPATPAPTVIVQPSPPSTPTAPPTVVVSPEKNELGKVDKIFGGEAFAGLKTPGGILIYCLAWALGPGALGYITPEIQSALFALATALAGIGITAKIDRVLPWLATITAIIGPKKK